VKLITSQDILVRLGGSQDHNWNAHQIVTRLRKVWTDGTFTSLYAIAPL
jgi:hypothetical protein